MSRLPVVFASALLGAFFAAGQGVGVSWAQTKNAEMSNDPNDVFLRGAVLVATGELDKAEKLAREALAKHPRSHGFHLLLGDVQARRKKWAEAFYEWQWEILRAGPDTHTGELATQRVGVLLSDIRGAEADEARLVIDAVMLTPKDPKAATAKLQGVRRDRGERFAIKVFLAEALQGSGAKDDAMKLWEELLREDPYFVPGHVQLAMLYKSKGREKDAIQSMQRARDIDPDNWRLHQNEPKP